MAISKTHFFTEANKLSPQIESKAFGAKSYTKYNLGSYHTASLIPKAFAITEGFMFAVEQKDTDYLNIVLIPVAPIGEFLPNIFCFIYKGIKKSSLLSSDELYIAESSLNDVTRKINEANGNFGQSFSSGESDGYSDSESSIESEEEDDAFVVRVNAEAIVPFKDESGTYKIRDLRRKDDSKGILIKAGDHIGSFDPGNIGLEIIMERWEMNVDLDLVRKGEHSLEVEDISYVDETLNYYLVSTIPYFKNKMAREEILNYLDPAAFFGSFYDAEWNRKLSYRIGTEEKSSREAELYTDVISKFYNHDVIYLDIRNALNYSINLFDNLSNTVKIYPGTLRYTNFNYRRNKWPLLALKTNDFYSPTIREWSDYLLQFRVQLPAGADLPAPEIYVHCRKPITADKNQARINNKFVSAISVQDTAGEFTLKIGKRNGEGHIAPSTAYIPVANYIRLTYGTNYPRYSAGPIDFSENIHLVQNYLDQLFIPFCLDIEPKETEKMIIEKYSDDRMIAYQPSLNCSFICERGIAIGQDVITFFAYPRERALRDYDLTKNSYRVQSTVDYNNSNLLDDLSSKFDSVEAVAGYLEFASDSIPFHQLIQFRDEASTDPNLSELISLTLTRSEYDDIKTLRNNSGFSDCFPVYFGVISHDDAGRELNDRRYIQYKLVLRGLVEDTNEEKMVVKEVDTGKIITYVQN